MTDLFCIYVGLFLGLFSVISGCLGLYFLFKVVSFFSSKDDKNENVLKK